MKDSTLDMQFSIIFIPLKSRLPGVMVSPRVSLSLQIGLKLPVIMRMFHTSKEKFMVM